MCTYKKSPTYVIFLWPNFPLPFLLFVYFSLFFCGFWYSTTTCGGGSILLVASNLIFYIVCWCDGILVLVLHFTGCVWEWMDLSILSPIHQPRARMCKAPYSHTQLQLNSVCNCCAKCSINLPFFLKLPTLPITRHCAYRSILNTFFLEHISIPQCVPEFRNAYKKIVIYGKFNVNSLLNFFGWQIARTQSPNEPFVTQRAQRLIPH